MLTLTSEQVVANAAQANREIEGGFMETLAAMLAKAPALFAQEDTDDPVMYLKLSSPGTTWNCYVAEASKLNGDLVLYGLFVGDNKRWGQLRLRKLEQDLQRQGLDLRVDQDFTPTKLSVLTGLKRARRNGSN